MTGVNEGSLFQMPFTDPENWMKILKLLCNEGSKEHGHDKRNSECRVPAMRSFKQRNCRSVLGKKSAGDGVGVDQAGNSDED